MGETVGIPLSSRIHKGLIAIVDQIDADLAEIKWHIHPQGYATRAFYANGNGSSRLMHRIILERILGRALEKGELCDHRDGNGLNNSRSNLRLANSLENAINRRQSSTTDSGYKGVYPHKGRNGWNAIITNKGNRIYLGYFSTPIAAARAYNAAALLYHGEFARLNIIPDEAQS